MTQVLSAGIDNVQECGIFSDNIFSGTCNVENVVSF